MSSSRDRDPSCKHNLTGRSGKRSLSKLEWYRMGGEVSDRQWRDILGILKTRTGDLDVEYLRKWAAELHVSDLLERALQESS